MASNNWNSVLQREATIAKTADRRIEFHKAIKPENGFQNTQALSGKGKQPQKGGNLDTKSKSNKVVGLFDPNIVQKYSQWQKIIRVGPGLNNLGNTCFLNSTLQCLFYIPAFNQILLQQPEAVFGKGTEGMPVLRMFQKLVQQVWSLPGKAITPRALVQNIRLIGRQFRHGRQEDAHEYLRQLLDCMHEEILKHHHVKSSDSKMAETTMIGRVFGANLRNELKCPQCNYSSKTYNHFQDLSLEVSGGISSVSGAISAYVKPEKLTPGNEWMCDGCKKRVLAVKQLTIASAPSTLVVHLKRFSPFGASFGKINKHINYELTLELPCSEESQSRIAYNLVGVIVHHGSTVHSGHYVAYIKSSNGSWFNMDDEEVNVCSSKNVLNQKAYILFYARANTAAGSASQSIQSSSAAVPPQTVAADKPAPQNSVFNSYVGEDEGTAVDDEPPIDAVLKKRKLATVIAHQNNSPESKTECETDSSDEDSDGSYSDSDKGYYSDKPRRRLGVGIFAKLWSHLKPGIRSLRAPLRRLKKHVKLLSFASLQRMQHKRAAAAAAASSSDVIDDEDSKDDGDGDDDDDKDNDDVNEAHNADDIADDDDDDGDDDDSPNIADTNFTSNLPTDIRQPMHLHASSAKSDDSSSNSSDDSSSNSSDEDASSVESEGAKRRRLNEKKYRQGSSVVEHMKPISTIGQQVQANSTVAKDILFQSRRGREVGGEGLWVDEDDAAHVAVKQELKEIESKQRRLHQKDIHSKRASEWDQMLDAGKVKKIKTKTEFQENSTKSPNGNVFQNVLDYRRSKQEANGADGLREEFNAPLPKHHRTQDKSPWKQIGKDRNGKSWKPMQTNKH